MKVVIPQITWHSRDPVSAVDFDPSCNGEDGFYRVASGGGDCQLLIWRLSSWDSYKPDLICVAELKRHEKPVNVVRFSPDGSLIATGGDDAYIILWRRGELSESQENQENWVCEKSLRKHVEDVSDLSWSPDGNFLISCSIDNTAVLWDIKKTVAVHVWSEKEHNGFLNGVSYDPMSEVAATMCIDRTLRFFDLKSTAKKLINRTLKYPNDWITEEFQEEVENAEKENMPAAKIEGTGDEIESATKKKSGILNRIFQDESLPTFFRRLCFSPKGELLLVPGGMLPPGHHTAESAINNENPEAGNAEDEEKKGKEKAKKKLTQNNHAVVAFCRHSWTQPCAVIPTMDSYSVGCRFCPVYFKNARQQFVYDPNTPVPAKNEKSYATFGKLAAPKQEKNCLMKMPYRLVYAVATNNSVILGDTSSSEPLAVIRSIHLARITDVTWSSNGQALLVSSTDGYCSIITFEKGELGEEFIAEPDNFPAITRDCFPILPPEPKTPKMEKILKKKTPKSKPVPEVEIEGDLNNLKTPKDTKEQSTCVGVGTPKSGKKKPIQCKQITAMFAAAASGSAGKASTKDNDENGVPGDCKKPVETTKIQAVEAVQEGIADAVQTKDDVHEESKEIPKPKGQKTTLDKWIQKTPKTPETTVNRSISKSQGTNSAKPAALSIPPEIIEIDDDDDEPPPKLERMVPLAPANNTNKLQARTLYPMTPPPAKPIAVRRVSISTSSPLVSSPNASQKRKHEDVTPEELQRLTTAPIKCRKITEERQLIMESSNTTIANVPSSSKQLESGSSNGSISNASTTKDADTNDPGPSVVSAVTPKSDNNLPSVSSPVSSSAQRPPRRIIPLKLGPTAQSSNSGKLD